MKKFCISLREHAKSIIDFENRKMLPLTKEELKSHPDAKVYYNCKTKKSLKPKKGLLKIKIIETSEIIVIIQVNIEAQHIVFVSQKFKVPNKIPQFFITVHIIIIIL